MNRRSYLKLLGNLGLIGAAGCLSRSSESPSAGTPTTVLSPPDVDTPAPGECEPASVPQPETAEGLPDPRPYPDRPGKITPQSVQPFLEEYEAAYRYNRRLAEIATAGNCLRHLDMFATESRVASAESGIVGEVITRGSFTGDSCPGTTGTATPSPLPHVDLPAETAQYYVTERFLLRNGVVVECWD